MEPRRRADLLDDAMAITAISPSRGPQLDGAFDRGPASIPRLPARDTNVHSRSGVEAARTLEQVCPEGGDARSDPGIGPIAGRQDGFPSAMASVGGRGLA